MCRWICELPSLRSSTFSTRSSLLGREKEERARSRSLVRTGARAHLPPSSPFLVRSIKKTFFKTALYVPAYYAVRLPYLPPNLVSISRLVSFSFDASNSPSFFFFRIVSRRSKPPRRWILVPTRPNKLLTSRKGNPKRSTMRSGRRRGVGWWRG